MAHKVMGEWLQQFTCPSCGQIGADSPFYMPLCHVCGFKVQMKPSHNGRILDDWKPPEEADDDEVVQ
jgi:hypothetical protein